MMRQLFAHLFLIIWVATPMGAHGALWSQSLLSTPSSNNYVRLLYNGAFAFYYSSHDIRRHHTERRLQFPTQRRHHFSITQATNKNEMSKITERHGGESGQSTKKRGNSTTEKSPKTSHHHLSEKRTRERKRMKKSDLNDLIRGIGLTPVETSQNRMKLSEKERKEKVTKESTTNGSRSNTLPQTEQIIAEIPLKTQLSYARNGHAVLRSFLPSDLIHTIRSDLIQHAQHKALEARKQKVEVASNSVSLAQSCHTVEDCVHQLQRLGLHNDVNGENSIPFLQHFNTRRHLPSIHKLCTSPLLGYTASRLMDVPTVRLYQDSLFHKRVNDGPTPYHSDARMAPFDTSNMITFWIPLQHIPSPSGGGTALFFVDKSHSDFALPYWNRRNDDAAYDRLDVRYGGDSAVRHYMPLNVGDVTVHSGWTLHCADGNNGFVDEKTGGGKDRYALAITYVDGKAEIREDAILSVMDGLMDEEAGAGEEGAMDSYYSDSEDRWSFKSWIRDVPARSQFEHELVPIVWPPSREKD